jgi:SOS-response transcriptional repressor LexA
MKKRKITQLDVDVFDYLVNYKKDNGGNTPSIREIVKNTKAQSTSVIAYSLEKLEDYGSIKQNESGKKGVSVIGEQWVIDLIKIKKPELGKRVRNNAIPTD